MTQLLKLPIYLATFATLLSSALTAQAGTSGIHDNAGFFSEGAKADATANINDVQRKLKKDVCVETFVEIPADIRGELNLQDKAAVNRVCEQWSLKRAKELMINGVYVLLVKQPAHLQVQVGNDTQRQAFTLVDRDRLVNTMLAKLRAKDNDGALREGMSYVAATMRGHATSHSVNPSQSTTAPVTHYRTEAPKEKTSGGGWLISLLIIGVVAWLVIALIRAIFRGGMSSGGAGGMTPGASGGGGGFMRSMMGGMFGAAAGMWLYDQFSGGHSSAYGAQPENRLDNNGNGVDSGFTGQDTDYSSSGGSFGNDDSNSGGGGDSGGGGFDGGGGGFDGGGGGFDGGGGGGDSGGGGGGDF